MNIDAKITAYLIANREGTETEIAQALCKHAFSYAGDWSYADVVEILDMMREDGRILLNHATENGRTTRIYYTLPAVSQKPVEPLDVQAREIGHVAALKSIRRSATSNADFMALCNTMPDKGSMQAIRTLLAAFYRGYDSVPSLTREADALQRKLTTAKRKAG